MRTRTSFALNCPILFLKILFGNFLHMLASLQVYYLPYKYVIITKAGCTVQSRHPSAKTAGNLTSRNIASENSTDFRPISETTRLWMALLASQ